MKSVMNHTFSQVPRAEIPRSSFDRSHGLKTTFDSGYLIPVFVDEALPGDTFNLRMTSLARLATPLVPVMDNIFLDTFFFTVPVRLVWDNWQKFNGEQIDPDDSTDFLIPQMQAPGGGYDEQSLSDYFGIPTKVAGLSHSALWHRAYNLIWNEWFRDQNLQDSVIVDKDDANSDPADYVLLKRGKRHDYFTSCLPWPQKGPAVTLPLGSSAPVFGASGASSSNAQFFENALEDGINNNALRVFNTSQDVTVFDPEASGLLKLGTKESYDIHGGNPPYADLSEATASTINALREAFQIQKLFERDARGGTRYTEIIRAHFGVTSDDARLQRPEYLGGGSQPVNLHPVAQTSGGISTEGGGTESTTPQGNLAAFGTSQGSGHGFVKSFTEHSLIIGLVSARVDLNYQQGLNRMWSRRSRFDFYWPALSHIGEQAVLNKEIYANNDSNDDEVFGYQERYAEYRYKPSVITGRFRSNATQSMEVWHLAQDFASVPLLNEEFIEEDPPLDRLMAVPSEPQFLFDSYFQFKTARPMPVYSVPGRIDHF